MALKSESPGFDLPLCSLNSFLPDRVAEKVTVVKACWGLAQSQSISVHSPPFPLPSIQLPREQGGASPPGKPYLQGSLEDRGHVPAGALSPLKLCSPAENG